MTNMDRFQDSNGPVGALAIFYNGAVIAEAPEDLKLATDLRNAMEATYPGCEVLSRCTTHPEASAVDCLTCWPLDEQ